MCYRYNVRERGCKQVRDFSYVLDNGDTYFSVFRRAAARQLSDRCTQLLEVIRDEGTSWPDGQFDEATRQAEL
jgi:hypothetical protein